MKPILILLCVFALGLLTCSLASAGDCHGGRCPTVAIVGHAVVAVPVAVVRSVGIVIQEVAEHRPVRSCFAERQPVRRTVRGIARVVAWPFRCR